MARSEDGLGIYGIKPWFQKQLQPLAKALWHVHPDALTWGALGVSMGAASLLYSAYDEPMLALAAAPLLLLRLGVNACREMVASDNGAGSRAAAGRVIGELGDRLCDVAIFLPFAFWPEIRMQIVLLAMVSMLVVSYVGLLGKAVGPDRANGGLLSESNRMILLMVACVIYAIMPANKLYGFNIFEVMFILFIPLASVTLLQRLDKIFASLERGGKS
jgi:hypothetical protein